MRTPQDIPARAPSRGHARRRWYIIGAIVVLIVIILSLRSLATIYTDSLWFSSVDLHRVWSTLFAIKLGLFASFGAVFFVALWINLVLCDRWSAAASALDPEDELVRRYQRAIRPYAGRVYVGVAFVLALITASSTIGQWNNWILFTHGVSFGAKDPQFHMDIGFFVFKLPFISFLVNWCLAALLVILIVTAIFHYLNGGIRAQRGAPRVRPVVKAHLSVLLALMALVKAVGYYFQRFQLDVSTNGYVEGAGYTDVHARPPALELLVAASICAAAILLYNIRRQGWTLPVIAIGVWAFVALAIGVIYPAVLQALKVNPAQSTLEQPYIKRNIEATRAAYGLDQVKVSTFQGNTSITAAGVDANLPTLENIRLWDPDPSIALPTFQKLQDVRSYYTIQSVAVDRYTVGGTLRPVVVGVRQINPTDLPSSSWVNTHLQYTHGQGLVLAEANGVSGNGNPLFEIQDVPPSSSDGLPTISQPGVYFGLNAPGFVVADTKQAELDYQTSTGADVETHYTGTGGVEMGSLLTRAAFALRMSTINLLLSDLITPKSRMIFVRDVQTMAEKAAPFLSYGSHPYAAVVNGHIDWILNGYTTTSDYPYSQNASTQQVPPGSGLPSSYNYVRNSVKVVINAYSGKMTFYAMDNDPILRAYEAAFPHMFVPASRMTSQLQQHLRYPDNLFAIQAAVYGRYHITTPSNFYTAGDAWNLSPTTGVGSPSNALAVTYTTNPQGVETGATLQRMSPLYQVLKEPGESGQSFTISDAYVPAAQGASIQNLSAFIMGNSDPGQYGQLHVYVTKPGHSVVGPALADSYITQNSAVSTQITRLDQHGSTVILGNILMVPIDQSMLYIRPLYVQSKGNPQPQLKEIIAVYGQKVGMESTLNAALSDVLGTKIGTGVPSSSTSTTPSSPPPSGTSTTNSTASAQAEADLKQASSDYAQAQSDLKAGTLGGYQSEVTAMEQEDADAEALLGTGTAKSSSGTTPTTSSGSTTTTSPRAPSTSTSTPAKKSSAKKSTTTTTSRTSEA